MLLLCVSVAACWAAKKQPLSSASPVAVMSVTGNKAVPWFDGNEKSASEGALTGKINEKMNKLSTERATAVSRLDYALEGVRFRVEEKGAQMVEKERVLGSSSYKNNPGGTPKYLSAKAVATGYKSVFDMGRKNVRAVLSELGAQSAMFLDFEFWKVRKNSKELAALVILRARVVNADGKEIVSKRYSVESESRILLSGNSYNTEQLLSLLEFTVDDALDKFFDSAFG